MKERPILFSAPMVCALLAGTKTQTRRAMRDQVCTPGIVRMARPGYCEIINEHDVHVPGFYCPYGAPGDRLWVRETWQHQPGGVIYDAAGGVVDSHEDETIYRASRPHYPGPWKPSIFMPRWATRLLLEVTEVRVERLQDISEADAMAEGIVSQHGGGWGLPAGEHFHLYDPRISYWSLWETINGAGAVDRNPWVWVVSFRRTKQ